MIPRDKYDEKAVEELSLASDDDVIRNVDQLLEWIQDRNWPVFEGIAKRLSVLGDSLVMPIEAILMGNDSEWKANIVGYLIPEFSLKSQFLYVDILENLRLNCSQDDVEEGVLDFVEILLAKLDSST